MHGKSKILLVDDEESIKRPLRDVLSEDYIVFDANNGKEAFEILKEEEGKIAAIVLDLIMPVMDGVTFLEEFQKIHEYHKIPILVATSSEDEGIEQRCLELGVWDFVMKPYNPVLLLFRIRNAIEKSKMIIAERDPVTGLYSKMKFYQDVRQMLLKVNGEKYAFVRFDIDRFKMINNFYGVKEGDRVLVAIANELKRISESFENFIYGRLENDVFAVCMPYKEENIELLVNALEIRLKKVNKDYNIKVSCGVYVIDDYNMDVSEMYDRAFLAAKTCKGKFMQNVSYYEDSMIENMRQEQYIINDVNKAIEEEQFVVYLQPKINLITDKSYGAEALVRWIHPEKGMISPAEFIPVYERNGIIGRLDQYMWRHVCMLLRKWLDEGLEPSPISVNVSRVNLYNPHLVDILKNMITEYQIPAHLLNLELTESAFMEDQDLIMNTMKKLHNLGFRIMMDDFGSGYSSLNILKDMELDYLKVDMKFLDSNEFNGRGEKVLTSVIRMAKWLHIPAIVEGVETEKQVDFLKCIGCEYAQGYYFAKPMPVEEYEKFVAEERKKEEDKLEGKIQNADVLNELWNTKSNIVSFLDCIIDPIAIFEYRNAKFELLRSNISYNTIFSSTETDDTDYEKIIQKAFKELTEGRTKKVIKYRKKNGILYCASVNMLGKRNDTYVIMLTYFDISEYK